MWDSSEAALFSAMPSLRESVVLVKVKQELLPDRRARLPAVADESGH
jgi:hypothetical protein